MEHSAIILPYLEHFSYAGIFSVLVVVGYIIPIPEEIVIILVGYVTSVLPLHFWITVPVTILGLWIGDNILFYLLLHGDRHIIKFQKRIKPEKMERYRAFMERHSAWAIFVARFIPGLRFLSAIVATTAGVPARRFAFYDFLALPFYSTILVGLGFRFQEQLSTIIDRAITIRHLIGITIIIGIGVALAFTASKSLLRRMSNGENNTDGKLFAVWKPKGPTSNDILNQIRKIAGTRHVGHAGTLDPLAEGILIVGIGRAATKKLGKSVSSEKEYLADITLGAISATDDAEGPIRTNKEARITDYDEMKEILKSFVGKIQQFPPIYSAVKIKGKEAYKYARKGIIPEMKPREVEIKNIEILEYDWPILKLKVKTGPGVYIRSLARDIGKRLGCGAYLSGLTRTRIGNFTLANAVPLEKIR